LKDAACAVLSGFVRKGIEPTMKFALIARATWLMEACGMDRPDVLHRAFVLVPAIAKGKEESI